VAVVFFWIKRVARPKGKSVFWTPAVIKHLNPWQHQQPPIASSDVSGEDSEDDVEEEDGTGIEMDDIV